MVCQSKGKEHFLEFMNYNLSKIMYSAFKSCTPYAGLPSLPWLEELDWLVVAFCVTFINCVAHECI